MWAGRGALETVDDPLGRENTRYWVRDTRRSDFVVGGTNKLHHRKYELDVTSVKLEGLPPMPPRGLGGWKATDFSLTQTNLTSGARVPYLDNPNDGYTQ